MVASTLKLQVVCKELGPSEFVRCLTMVRGITSLPMTIHGHLSIPTWGKNNTTGVSSITLSTLSMFNVSTSSQGPRIYFWVSVRLFPLPGTIRDSRVQRPPIPSYSILGGTLTTISVVFTWGEKCPTSWDDPPGFLHLSARDTT